MGRGPPPKKINRENLKSVLTFSVLESITFGIVEVFSLNFFMRPAITAREISSSWIDFALGLAAPGGLTSSDSAAVPHTSSFCLKTCFKVFLKAVGCEMGRRW